MEEHYDYIILGTGLTECILAAVFACHGKKVLHIDRNEYYGADCASLDLDRAFQRFKKVEKAPASFGRSRDYNIDMVPKFPIADGQIMEAVIHTDVKRYMEFVKTAGAYTMKKGKTYKVPANEKETLTTGIMGLFEKKKLQNFVMYLMKVEEGKPQTYDGFDVTTQPMRACYQKFGLDPESCDFIGHAMALYQNDDYLDQPALPTLQKIKLYLNSVAAYGNSPFIYPRYGVGELGQSFARLAAVFGAVYILNRPIDEIIYNEKGQATGIKAGGESATADHIVGDPSYFPDKVKKTGSFVRKICIMNHTVPKTDNADSGMMVIPQKELKRHNDVYLSWLSYPHRVCPQGYYLAFLSTTVETGKPEAELDGALKLIEPVLETFTEVTDLYEPISVGDDTHIHISKSIDGTSHFETLMEDVYRLYKELTGEDLDLKKEKEAQEKTREAAGAVFQSESVETKSEAKEAPAPPPSQE
ncbi:putative Rab GDP dissociation inhibitor alpha [Blattamonas nauphoetae]|uniref:Rab GDP dissociation inhibitor n=1 Tax=Blattamonas nauphoetae TaxID=2049346 RepID=A0ABQ9Y2T3_9EUKA|nr:putative Rab GDP dissociation inhibitor alpha [Blattamonas nauphoetae]